MFSFHELVKQMKHLSQSDRDRWRETDRWKTYRCSTTDRAFGQSLCTELADSVAEKKNDETKTNPQQTVVDKRNNIKIDYNH